MPTWSADGRLQAEWSLSPARRRADAGVGCVAITAPGHGRASSRLLPPVRQRLRPHLRTLPVGLATAQQGEPGSLLRLSPPLGRFQAGDLDERDLLGSSQCGNLLGGGLWRAVAGAGEELVQAVMLALSVLGSQLLGLSELHLLAAEADGGHATPKSRGETPRGAHPSGGGCRTRAVARILPRQECHLAPGTQKLNVQPEGGSGGGGPGAAQRLPAGLRSACNAGRSEDLRRRTFPSRCRDDAMRLDGSGKRGGRSLGLLHLDVLRPDFAAKARLAATASCGYQCSCSISSSSSCGRPSGFPQTR
mmetsp:Transcript_60793/g.96285  ORF Transcript_60793/g.96285 Transcript_60793/m.96285 type:complete len:305 (+) Transcript_60793:489-1403(+)